MNRFYTLGLLLLFLGNACKNNDASVDTNDNNGTANIPANIPFQIVKEYPHDSLAFTEGLQYVDGKLYESVGEYGESDIRITDLATGKTTLKQPLEENYFGEGLTVLNGKAYQLSYKEKTGFVYDATTLQLERTFTFNQGEGWGLTNNGKHLIMSNGGSSLFFLDTATFREASRVDVTDQYGPVSKINELEYIKGYIYANQWQEDVILKIDPASGRVVGKVDLSTLRARTGIPKQNPVTGEGPEVLNGIAYDSANNKIFITGKNWPKLIEVKLDN